MLTRFSSLSDVEFERELGLKRDAYGQLTLSEDMSTELLERVRRWTTSIETMIDHGVYVQKSRD